MQGLNKVAVRLCRGFKRAHSPPGIYDFSAAKRNSFIHLPSMSTPLSLPMGQTETKTSDS